MSRKSEAAVNSGDGGYTYRPNQHAHIPSIEEQFKALQPSQELLDFYRKKLANYEKEFTRMTERVNMCKRSCESDNTIKTELTRCNNEVFKLQKALSDMQVYLHQERNQVLLLHAENDRLKIQLAKDRKTINFLLLLCGATEEQVCYLMQSSNAESLSATKSKQAKGRCQVTKPPEAENGTEMDIEILSLKVNSLEAHLKELRKVSQDEIHSLHQDRELIQMEKEKEYKKLQNQIKILTDRLTEAQINICELTTEIITMKKDFIKKEEKWMLDKEMVRHKKFRSHGCTESSEHFEQKAKAPKDSLVKVFKDQLQQKERLIKMYKEECASLENQLWELNNSKEKSNEMLMIHMEKLYKHLYSIKGKYDQLYRKRSLEVEGFENDVKILKGRLRSLERKLTCSVLSASVPQRKLQIENAKWLKAISKCLEKELLQIESKVLGSKNVQ